MKVQRVLFIDTNILLHYLPIAQIDWVKLVDAKSVNIVIAPIVTTELDRKKIDKDAKIKKRATRSLTEILQILESSKKLVRKNVSLEFMHIEPTEFSSHGLDPMHPDDRLIAAILKYQHEKALEEITLVSGDVGCRLKAMHRGIPTLSLPEELKLPEEPDPNEQKVKELEVELRAVKAALPKVTLHFDNRDNKVFFEQPNKLAVPHGLKTLEEVKDRYHKITEFPNHIASLIPALKSRGRRAEQEADIVKLYNACLDKYYDAYERYHARAIAYHMSEIMPFIINIIAINSGGAPAEDVDLVFQFPSNIELSDNLRSLKPPPEPVPPKWIETNNLSTLLSRYTHYYPHEPSMGQFILNSLRNRKKTDTKYGVFSNQGKALFNIKSLKHHFSERLPGIRIIFSPNQYQSFQIKYSIYISNLTKVEHGNLNVISKEPTVAGSNLSSPSQE